MYVPSQFEEQRPEVLRQLIGMHPLGTLVTCDEGTLHADHIPLTIDPAIGPLGTLQAHVARNNPLWKNHLPGPESLVVFQGAQSYISPSWYASKQDDGRVVPTYNYMVVHVYGHLRVIDDPHWLRAFLGKLVDRFETTQSQPWRLDDAPEAYIEKLLPAIVGIELTVTRMLGKWKVSQNQPQPNRASVELALREQGDTVAIAMADAVARKA